MSEIVLNVEVRERTGTGASRGVRRADKVPGVLYGGPRGPVSIAIETREFRKALYTGKLLGHLVTLKHGDETQPVIAKDIQFHPVTDMPIHFDLFRVEEHQLVRIAVPVHFKNAETSPGLKRGGALNIVRHEVELWVPADEIPEELIADLEGLEIGAQIRVSALNLPTGAEPAISDRDFVIATITGHGSVDAADEAAETPAG